MSKNQRYSWSLEVILYSDRSSSFHLPKRTTPTYKTARKSLNDPHLRESTGLLEMGKCADKIAKTMSYKRRFRPRYRRRWYLVALNSEKRRRGGVRTLYLSGDQKWEGKGQKERRKEEEWRRRDEDTGGSLSAARLRLSQEVDSGDYLNDPLQQNLNGNSSLFDSWHTILCSLLAIAARFCTRTRWGRRRPKGGSGNSSR